jgi:hypothetical protein
MLKILNGFLQSIRVVAHNCLQHSSPWVLERSEVLLFQANEMPFMIALDSIFWWARFHSLAGVIFALPFREVQEPCAFAILPGKKVRGCVMNTDTITLAVGSFADRARAQQAVDGLRRAGFREDQVAVICKKTQSLTDEIFAILSGIGLSHAEAGYYQKASDAGQTLVVVEAQGRYRAAQLILERNGSRNPYSDEGHPQDEGPRLVGYPFSWDSERN